MPEMRKRTAYLAAAAEAVLTLAMLAVLVVGTFRAVPAAQVAMAAGPPIWAFTVIAAIVLAVAVGGWWLLGSMDDGQDLRGIIGPGPPGRVNDGGRTGPFSPPEARSGESYLISGGD